MDFHLFSIIVDFFHIYFFSIPSPPSSHSLSFFFFWSIFHRFIRNLFMYALFLLQHFLLCVCVHVYLFQQKIHVCKNDKHRTGLVVDNRFIQKTNRRSGFQSKCQQNILFLFILPLSQPCIHQW